MFSDHQLLFPARAVGSAGPPQAARLKNYGTEPISLTSPTLGGIAANDFVSPTISASQVFPGSEAILRVSFAPTAEGERSARATVTASDGTGASLTLIGTGTPKLAEAQDAPVPARANPDGATTVSSDVMAPIDELRAIKVVTRTEDTLMLQPWKIFALSPKNTPNKSRNYKRFVKARSELRRKKAAVASAKAGKAKGKALTEFEKATREAEASTHALRDFTISPYWLANAEGQHIKQKETQQKEVVQELERQAKRSAAPEASERLRHEREKLAELTREKGEHYKVTEAEVEELLEPGVVQRNYYTIEIDGETISLKDHVEAYATILTAGLDGGSPKEQGQKKHETVSDALDANVTSDSVKKILRTVSQNEGGFTKVNTWDCAVLTWGFMQWTGGSDSDLTHALKVIKRVAPDAFANRFQRYGIDVKGDDLIVIDLEGNQHAGKAAAQVVGTSPALTAVFSRAGLDADIQRGQIAVAIQYKIDNVLNATTTIERGDDKATMRIGDVVTSEYGVGLLCDCAVHGGEPTAKAAAKNGIRSYLAAHPEANVKRPSDWRYSAEKEIWPKVMKDWSERGKLFIENGCSQDEWSFSR